MHRQDDAHHGHEQNAGSSVRDPVCGMTIDPAKAAAKVVRGDEVLLLQRGLRRQVPRRPRALRQAS